MRCKNCVIFKSGTRVDTEKIISSISSEGKFTCSLCGADNWHVHQEYPAPDGSIEYLAKCNNCDEYAVCFLDFTLSCDTFHFDKMNFELFVYSNLILEHDVWDNWEYRIWDLDKQESVMVNIANFKIENRSQFHEKMKLILAFG